MIVAVEGPDLCGKTAFCQHLLDEMPDAIMAPKLEMTVGLKPLMHEVQLREAAIWRAMEHSALTVHDRFLAISGPIYDEFFGRPTVDYGSWPDILVVYLRLDPAELHRRYMQRGDEHVTLADLRMLTLAYDRKVLSMDFVLNPTPSEVAHAVRKRYGIV